MGAFNDLDLDEFHGLLKSIEWEEGEKVQLLVRTDEDEIFEEVD